MSGRPDRGAPGIAALADRHGDVQVLPASFAQRRFWVLDQLDGEAAYTLPAGVRLRGTLDVEALRGALNAIVARHEALRTVFALEGDEPVQVVLPSVSVPLPVEDLRGTPAEMREDLVRARADANANAPFSLAVGPLLRASLLRLADDDHVLLLSLHHIVADGWSIGVLFQELEGAYTALVAGTEPALPPLPLQYPDFAVWQRRAMEGAAAARQIAYWTDRLRDVPAVELPTDRARPPVQTLNGAHRELAIDGDVAESIRALARREGATPYIGFLAAFVALVHRYTGQTDFAVGSLTSGRRRPEVEPLIGLFLNTLAIRAEPTAGMSFLELLRGVRDSATAAYANEDVPFEHVVDAVQPVRDRSRSPIFQVAFQLLETLARDLRLPGLTASRVSGSKHTAKFELTLMLHAAPRGGLRAVLEYNTDLFDAATIDRMLSHYATLLAGVARDPGASVGRLPLMGGEEYALVTERWNQSADLLPAWTLPQRVLVRAAAQPNAVAVRAGDTTLSYGDLARRSAALAGRLTRLGAGPGDRIAVCLDRSTELVVALLAVHRAGAAYVPLDAEHPPDRLAHMLGDAGVRAVLTDAASVARLPAVDVPVLTLDPSEPVADASGAFTAPLIDPESAAYVIYTSGSTGKPKGVTVPHRALANFLASMAARPGLAEGDALLAVTTVGFDIAGLELWLPLVTGARVELASRAVAADGTALRALLETTAGSVGRGQVLMQATPATWSLLLEAGWKGAPNLVMLCGGEAWPPRLAEALLPRGAALWNVYGPTETTIWSARHCVTRADDVPLGEPLANTTLLVLEPTGEPAPLGVPGELWIGGAGLALGYHGRPDLTAERFVTHPRFGRLYRTGDRVRRRGDGSLEYLGRLDDQIKLRGYRIELGEIESVLAVQPGVARAVVALRRDTGEPRLVAYVVLARDGGDNGPRLAALLEPLRRALPDYMVPASIVGLDALPLSPSGKVDRRGLPAPADDGGAARDHVPPRTPLEEQIARVWAAVLGRERVGVEDDFFALGGHSLLAMRVVARLADVAPVRLTIGALFDARTVAALAALVERRLATPDGDDPGERIEPRGGHGPAPLSYAQELIWLYEQMKPGTAAYHIPMARRVRGPLDAAALRRAFGTLVERHESLRTAFVEQGGVASQVVVAPAPVNIEQHDLRTRPAESRDAEAERLLQEAAARPFDLSEGTQPRVVLIGLADDEALLLVVVHHIVFDGTSAGVLLGELATAYAAAADGGTADLPPLPIQLADVAAWERRVLVGPRLEPALDYWRAQLQEAPSGIDLPTDFPRPPETVGPGARHGAMLSAETRAGVRALAAAHDVTPFVVLLAAFQTLLHRYSGQADLVVGTAVAGRERPGTAGLVGYLANTLALRARFDGDPTFSGLLHQVRASTLAALDHQDVPYEKLVRELRAGLPASEHTLFRVMFTLQDPDVSVPRLGGATLEPFGVDLGAAKFDLTMSAAEVSAGVEVVVEYRSDLFRADTIARLVSHLEELLSAACRAPETPVSRLPIVTAPERRLLLETWNDTDAAWPTGATVHELFAAQARRRPDAVAVEDDGQRLTYGELERRANRLAWCLRARGVGPDVLVGVCMEKSAEVVVVLLGILKAGGAYVPMDPAYPDDRLAFLLEDSGARIVVTDPALAHRLAGGGAELVLADAWADSAGARDDAPESSAGPGNLCYVIYTSGSTGRPKGVLIEHRNVVRLLVNDRLPFRFDERDVWTVFHSFSFDFSVWEMYGALLYGGRLVVVPRHIAQEPAAYLRLLETQRVTILNQVPSAFYALMQEELAQPRAALALRYVIFGGEALQPALLRDWKARYPKTTLVNMFGITETTVHVTYKEIGAAEIQSGASNIGGPIPTLTTYLLDRHLQPVPIGVTGELCVGGAGVARGYLNRPELTVERFVPHPFRAGERMYRSGDLGRLRPTGEIEYLGRRDSQVKLRGFRIELGEIEATLGRHPAVSACVAMLRAEGAAGLRLVAYYVPSGPPVERGALRGWLATRLPEFMVPAAFVELPALPLTPNGKVDRSALPDPAATGDSGAPMIAPRTPLEEQIAAVWAEVLGLERVSVEDDFFALGGHSLLAMRVVGRLAEVLTVRLTMAALFEARTVAALAALAVQRLAVLEAAASSDAELAAMLAEVEGLSDQDATRLLAAEAPEIP
jgi:amino acid adenylation domain-containing protein